ncbi:MAG: cysteine synthase A [Pseudomonadota bacterium]|jgi:cysteine synthase A
MEGAVTIDAPRAGLIGAIGQTPLLRLSRIAAGTGCEILGKAEFLNPGGSVKDRAALALVRDAERRGLLAPGGTVVEGTAGNTGIGLAHVCNALGYRCVLVLPDNQSPEKYAVLQALGAEVRTVPAVPYANDNHYQKAAARLAGEIPGAVWANQFDNPANRDAHAATTAPELWAATGGRLHAFVAAAGTGGTLAGVGRGLKARDPSIRIVLADPPGSALHGYVNTGALVPDPRSSVTEGVGIGRVTANFDGAPVDEALRIEDADTVAVAHRLLREEGLFLGFTSGLNVAAALALAHRLGPGHVIATILCDGGARYQSRLYNREWLAAKGFAAG